MAVTLRSHFSKDENNRVVVWTTLIVALSSTVSFAEPPLFLPGRYVLPIMAHDLYVSPPGQPGTTVTVNFRFKPIRACEDTLDSVLVYQLPPDYNSAPINEVSATCNKTIRCGGMEFRCIGAKQPYPMTFRSVPSRNIKATGDSFSGTYKYVSESIPRPRAALLRRASIGNFETVEESTDNTRSVRFRMGQ